MQAPGRLIIRTYAPVRRWLVVGGVAVLALLLLYVAYEAGGNRARAHASRIEADYPVLQGQVAELESLNRELRLKLATQETGQVGATRERAEVARTIGELQAQVARQAQDLAFYRGLAGDTSAAPPVRIQQFRITPAGTPGQYALRLVLARPVRPEDVVAGTLTLTMEGAQGDTQTSLDLARLTAGKATELRFSYRYLQVFEQALTLPPGFRPARTSVELRVSRKGVDPVRQSFLWNVEDSA